MRGSPRISCSLTRRRVPSPPQTEHAPNGELNEKWRGSSSGSEMPHVGTAVALGEQLDRARLSALLTSTTPSASLSAVSIGIGEPAAIFGAHDEPVDDDRDRMVLSAIELGRRRDLDQLAVDVRANEPLLAHASRTARGTRPFVPARAARALRSSRRAASRARSRRSARRSAAAPARPQFGQCGVPARAQSRRR